MFYLVASDDGPESGGVILRGKGREVERGTMETWLV